MQICRLLLLSSLLLPLGMLTHANLEVVAAQQSPSASWNAHSCKSGGCSCSAVSFCLLECSLMQIWRLLLLSSLLLPRGMLTHANLEVVAAQQSPSASWNAHSCKFGGCCCSAVSFCLLECALMQIWRLLLLSSLLLPLGMLTHANLEVVAAQQSPSASWNAHSCKSGGCCCSAVSFYLLMLTHANLEVVAAQQSPSASWNAHSCKSGGCCCSAVSFCLLECSLMQIWRLLLLSSLLLPLGMLTHANLEVGAAQQSPSASWNAHSCKSGGCCCSAVSFCLLECSLMQIWRLLLSLLLLLGMLTHANLEVVAAQQSPSTSWNAHSCKSGGCSCSAVSFCLLECSLKQIWRLLLLSGFLPPGMLTHAMLSAFTPAGLGLLVTSLNAHSHILLSSFAPAGLGFPIAAYLEHSL